MLVRVSCIYAVSSSTEFKMKKYLNIKSGFLRNKKGLELNWSIYDWALPLSVDFSSEHLIFIRLFCVAFILPRT